MKKNISISTLSITIRTIVLDGKRFTKSVFNQLPETYLYLKKEGGGYSLSGEIIGFVRIPEDPFRWILLKRNGVLYKVLGKAHRDISNFESKYHPHKSYLMEGVDKFSSESEKAKDNELYDLTMSISDSEQLFISI